jgi:hypothetical protein
MSARTPVTPSTVNLPPRIVGTLGYLFCVAAPANLRLAQRHYQARMLELRELIALEEATFK